MTDHEMINSIGTSAKPFRIGYAVSAGALFLAACLAGILLYAHPAGQGLLVGGIAGLVTTALFSFRLSNGYANMVRYLLWAVAFGTLIVLGFGVSVSENLGFRLLNSLGQLGEDFDYARAVEQVSMMAAMFGVAALGSLMSFIYGAVLDVKKYHTFLCIRLMRVRIINYVVTLAVACSVFVLIVVLSVMWGFERDLRARIRGTLAPVSIEAHAPERVTGYEETSEWIVKNVPHVTEVAPFVQTFSFLRLDYGPMQYTSQAFVRGIDPAREQIVGDFASYMRFGKKPDFMMPEGGEPTNPGILLGSELARSITRITDDEEAKLLSTPLLQTRVTLSPPLGGGRFDRVPTFSVVGEFKTGYAEYDSRFVYVPIEWAQELAGYDYHEVSGLSIGLDDYRHADKVKQILEAEFAGMGYSVKTWAEQRPTLLAALHLERVVMTIILCSVVLVTGLFVLAVMLMAVKEKTRDIGLLKAIGGTVSGIMEIFLINGFVIGFVGAVSGGLAGLVFVYYVNDIARFGERFGLMVFPRDVYYLDEIPTHYDVIGIGMILCAAVAVSLLAALVPALIAARKRPVEALRHE